MLIEKIENQIIIATFQDGKTNPLDLETLRSLQKVVQKANEDESIKGIILTGAGRSFSSGFNLPMFLGFKNLEEVVAFFAEEEKILTELFTCKKPVVSAINGHAVAGGLIISMASDYRIIKNHPKIKVGMSEIKIGLGLSIAQTEIMRFGLDSDKKFRDVLYFSKMYGVEEAKQLELVDEIAEEDQLMDRAKQVICQWIDNPGRAFIPLKYSLKNPTAKRIKDYLANEDWQTPLKCFFDPATRKTLEAVQAMMG